MWQFLFVICLLLYCFVLVLLSAHIKICSVSSMHDLKKKIITWPIQTLRTSLISKSLHKCQTSNKKVSKLAKIRSSGICLSSLDYYQMQTLYCKFFQNMDIIFPMITAKVVMVNNCIWIMRKDSKTVSVVENTIYFWIPVFSTKKMPYYQGGNFL